MLQTIATGGGVRVDEMAYPPLTKQVLVANNADSPALGTILNTTPAPATIAHMNIHTLGVGGVNG